MIPSPELKTLLGQAFDRRSEGLREELTPEDYEVRRSDFVFHMTDWLSDLGRLSDLYANPDCWTAKAASREVGGFLHHVIPHLNAAGRLLLDDITDPFAQPATTTVAATNTAP